ncbi:MAG: diguanylate cyclase [Lachnospiraceae bacterium]|nr:diguanylate cyclase [Lachnospiraceae bacterium]
MNRQETEQNNEESKTEKELRKELAQTKLELKVLLDNIPGGVFSYDADTGKFDFISEGVLSIFQCTMEQFREHYYNSFELFVYKGDRASVREMIENQISFFDTVELTYRVRDLMDNIMWIIHKGKLLINEDGSRKFYVVISDVTTEKLVQQQLSEITEKLYIETERYKLIEEAADNTQYDYDVNEDVLTTSRKDADGNRIIIKDCRKNNLIKAMIFEEDYPTFESALKKAFSEPLKGVVEYRSTNDNGDIVWFRLNYASFEQHNRITRIVGSEKDITVEKRQHEELKAQVERDGMTGLLNKTTMQSEVEDYLKTCDINACHALLMIDTDNFKGVNDNLGHMSGDDVIKFVASTIKDTFRDSDFVGRMGGDEFMVFMKYTTPGITEERAGRLNSRIKRTITENGVSVNISCSIGIAYYGRDGEDYDSLYKAADDALYVAKEAGKDCYRVYEKG